MPSKQPEPHYLAIGRIVRPHGVRGELRVEVLTDFPDRIARLRRVYVGDEHRAYTLRDVRLHQEALLLRLEGVDDRNTADLLRGQVVSVAMRDAVPLEPGEYYHHQLLGVRVVTEAGEALGEIVELLSIPGANDVYVVHGVRGELLIPGISDVVRRLDVEAGLMIIHPLPGLLDDAD